MSTLFVDDVSVIVAEDNQPGGVTTVDLAAETAARIAADLLERAERIAADLLLIPLSQKGQPDGVATLDLAGLVPLTQLPPVSISGQTFDVASEAEMLALNAQPGDSAIRSDLNPDGFFILRALPATDIANWFRLLSPGNVQSVDGRTGTVDLSDRYDPLGAFQHAPVYFSKAGTVAQAVGKARVPITEDTTISRVVATLDTAPSGADMVFNLLRNDTTIVTVIVPAGTNTASVDVVGFNCFEGDYLTLDVIRPAETLGGWDLTVKVMFTAQVLPDLGDGFGAGGFGEGEFGGDI